MAQGILQKNLTMQEVINAIYPIGSVYISMNSTMPSAIAGVGTWQAITGDYVLRTITTGTGGTYVNAGNTGSTTLTIAQIPSHRHTYTDAPHLFTERNNSQGAIICTNQQESTNSMSYWTDYMGGGEGHNHTAGMPKNVSIYMWKRTA